jgi:hypothetical protein
VSPPSSASCWLRIENLRRTATRSAVHRWTGPCGRSVMPLRKSPRPRAALEGVPGAPTARVVELRENRLKIQKQFQSVIGRGRSALGNSLRTTWSLRRRKSCKPVVCISLARGPILVHVSQFGPCRRSVPNSQQLPCRNRASGRVMIPINEGRSSPKIRYLSSAHACQPKPIKTPPLPIT